MKTPMQELIYSLKRERMNPSNEWQIGYQKALINVISEAESMLEKEKDAIYQAWINGESGKHTDPKEYYNETFNTKEK